MCFLPASCLHCPSEWWWCTTFVLAVGEQQKRKQCVCPSCCLSGLQGWNHLSFVDLGEGKNWRLSCIPREVQELMAGTKTVFFVMVFFLCPYFSPLSLLLWLLRLAGKQWVREESEIVATCNLPILHWSLIWKRFTIQRHCVHCCEGFQLLPISSKMCTASISVLYLSFWCCYELLFFCSLHVFVRVAFLFVFVLLPTSPFHFTPSV